MNDLLNVKNLKQRLKAFAFCDAMLSPEWEHRFFSFDTMWNADAGEEMGHFRNGQGLEGFFLFLDGGCIGKVFDARIRPALTVGADDVPKKFRHFYDEPAFWGTPASLILWGEYVDDRLDFGWLIPENPEVFSIINRGFDAYYAWAVEYYEKDVCRSALRRAFETLSV